MPAPAPADHARQRELPQAELEAAAELKLGEFQNIPSLTLSEARLIINTILRSRTERKQEVPMTEYVS